MYTTTRPPAYAPTPYSYIPSAALSASINLDQEVRLPAAAAERDVLESLAEIYSILVALEGLEKAFNKDSVPDAEYAELCTRLLKQYRSNLGDERVARAFGDLEQFKAQWKIDCPRATERLRIGLPATMTDAAGGAAGSAYASQGGTPSMGGGGNLGGSGLGSGNAGHAAGAGTSTVSATAQSTILATENFITFLDALRLGIGSKDQLHPLLSDVIQAANSVTDREFEGRGHIIKWLIKLNGMRAHEELSDDDRREVECDIEAAYRGFKAVLR